MVTKENVISEVRRLAALNDSGLDPQRKSELCGSLGANSDWFALSRENMAAFKQRKKFV